MKEKAILAFHVGEFGWELLRFAPHVLWNKRTKYKDENVKLIVCTRQDRYDLYGDDVDIFHPFQIDETNLKQDCFKLTGWEQEYKAWRDNLYKSYSTQYDIIKMICPKIRNRQYTQKAQFLQTEMDFNFKPRSDNNSIFEFMYKNEKPIIAIGSRYREGVPRNWPYWKEFFDLIYPFNDRFNFIICGKKPDVVLDERFKSAVYTDPYWDRDEEWSLVGINIEIIKNAILTIGSQSGIPNLSNILGTPTIQWGNEKHAHTKTYNINDTETCFLDDPDYNIKPKSIFYEMINFLQRKGYLTEKETK